MKHILLIFKLTSNVQVDINMLKLLYLAELVDIIIKYIASNTSVMMSLSIGYPQILASAYPDSKFTIRFSPKTDTVVQADEVNAIVQVYIPQLLNEETEKGDKHKLERTNC